MNYITIAEGEDINALELCESMFLEGDYGEVRAFVTVPPPAGTIQDIEQQILSTGVTLTAPVKYNASTGAVVIRFRKMMPALQMIGLSLAALIVIGSAVFAWQIAQSVGGSPAAAIWIVLGVLGLVLFVKSAEGKAVVKAGYGAAKHVGKVYTERRMFIDKPVQQDIAGEVRKYHEAEAMRAARGEPYRGTAGRGGATGYSSADREPTGESDINEER